MGIHGLLLEHQQRLSKDTYALH